MSDKAVLVVQSADAAQMGGITAAADHRGVCVVDEREAPEYGTIAHHWPEIPPDIVVLTASPKYPEPVIFEENPPRAKKLKGRNRRKW